MRRSLIPFMLLGNLLLSACSDIALWIANRPADLAAATLAADQLYDAKHQLRLDWYRPRENPDAPVVIYCYGGGWRGGDKADYRFVADVLTRWGYQVVIPDYRKYPDAIFPGFVQDTAKATNYVLDRIAEEVPVFIMGHSAGAYNAAMMLADAQYLQAYNRKPADIRGFIGLAGPYNFTPTEKKYQRIFNNRDDYAFMKVNSYIHDEMPPMLLLHGLEDDTVSPDNTRTLAQALQDKGGTVYAELYDEIDHYEIIGVFTPYWKEKAPIRAAIRQFLIAHQ